MIILSNVIPNIDYCFLRQYLISERTSLNSYFLYSSCHINRFICYLIPVISNINMKPWSSNGNVRRQLKRPFSWKKQLCVVFLFKLSISLILSWKSASYDCLAFNQNSVPRQELFMARALKWLTYIERADRYIRWEIEGFRFVKLFYRRQISFFTYIISIWLL
jgi:hypothetical protein